MLEIELRPRDCAGKFEANRIVLDADELARNDFDAGQKVRIEGCLAGEAVPHRVASGSTFGRLAAWPGAPCRVASIGGNFTRAGHG
ncbi:MAG: hypothetical protein WAK35_15295 [Xanthobacteraceae bacterium]